MLVSTPSLNELLRSTQLLPIVRGRDPEAAYGTALTLLDEGIAIFEVSLTSVDALRTIERVRATVGTTARIGAGTVISADDARRAAAAGADFLVTPGLTGPHSADADALPVIAGALTPTEVIVAILRGATAVKLFPASLGGPSYLRALREPFPEVSFVAVGGITLSDATDYLNAGATAVGMGRALIGDAADGGNLNDLRIRIRAFLDHDLP